MGLIYNPIHKLRKDNMKTQQVNTTAEFKLSQTKKMSQIISSRYLEFVGGMVEAVTFPNGDLLLLNEEGKLMGLTIKSRGHCIMEKTFHKRQLHFRSYDDFVVGPAIVIRAKDALNTWAN